MNVRLINLTTGDVMIVDMYNLLDRGYPEGYVNLNNLSEDELFNLVKELIDRNQS